MEGPLTIVNKKRKSRALSVPMRILRGTVKLIFSVIILIFQLAWVFFAVYYYRNVPYLSVISYFVSIFVVLIICYTRQNSEYKLLWVMVILLLPFAGTVWYLLYGYGRSTPKRIQKEAEKAFLLNIPQNGENTGLTDERDKKIFTLLNKLSRMPLYSGQDVIYFTDGAPMYKDMLEKIESARHYVFIESFIVSEGRMLDELEALLTRKAKEGVIVNILFDSVGSYGRLKRATMERLQNHQNIEIAAFNRVGISLGPYINYRDHRKIVIVDGKYSYVGGINIADEYVHYIERYGFWRDGGVCIEGEAIEPLLYLFCQNWYMAAKVRLDINYFRSFIIKYTEEKKNSGKSSSAKNADKNKIFVFGDTSADSFDPAYNCCMSLFENAQKSICISTPYLILDDKMSSALSRAAQSGVSVKILTPGIPDKKIVYAVTRSNYRNLIENGVEIYEFTPGFNHCKSIVVDDKYALVGSINLDYRSLLLHYEVGALIENDKCIGVVKNDFNEAVSKSKLVTAADTENRSVFYKILQFLLHILAPLL